MEPKTQSKTELVDNDGGKKFGVVFTEGKKNGGRTSIFIAAAVFIIALACLIAGIVLMAKARKCDEGSNAVSSAAKSTKEQCEYSKEAKRIGLDSFLKKVQDTFYVLHPENIAWHPRADHVKIRKEYQAYDPTPAKIKERTDRAIALLNEINAKNENPNLLKPREYKALLQVKHYLKYMFGMPYDENYYAGDWMLGPNSFCWQAMCSLGYDIYNNIGYMKPRNYEEINTVIKHMKDINTTVFQYISNMKLGITTGMVRTKIECLGGLNAMKQSYVKVSDKGPNGVLSAWYVKSILNAKTFLKDLPDGVKDKWMKDKGKSVSETMRESVVTYIGTPIHKLLQYLENDHYNKCRPEAGAPGGLSGLPVDYVYNNGIPDKSKRTTKVLPISSGTSPMVINGSKSYEKILGYFTTKEISPDEVHTLGWKMVNVLYPEAVMIAKTVTKINDNDTKAVEEFQKILKNISVSFFNTEEIPKNESEGDAFKLCKTIEGAKKYCPNRWKAMEAWFAFARKAMAKLDPKTVNMFYFTGDKHTTPNCPVDLKPDFGPTTAAQSYQSSGAKCSSNSIYNIPFFLKNLGPKFSEYSVNAHEARPGHHTQVQGNAEHFKDNCGGEIKWLDDSTYYTAFTEGWALYAENPLIAKQTDVYNTEPMQKFGMLKWQIWRALRLVVDTGLHYKGFTRQQAIDLFGKYAWDKTDIATKEVLRYQSNPGQATAYMIGQLDIWRYRNETQKDLGKLYSLKEFHFQALSQGSSPLSYLESHLKKFRDCKKNPKKEGCPAVLNPPKLSYSSAATVDSSDNEELDLKMPPKTHYF